MRPGRWRGQTIGKVSSLPWRPAPPGCDTARVRVCVARGLRLPRAGGTARLGGREAGRLDAGSALSGGRQSADVVQVMNRIVGQVPREALDAEAGAVAACARTLPIIWGQVGEAVGETDRGIEQLGGNRRGVLLVVMIGNCGGILVPVGEGGVVGIEHEVETLVEEPEHVADVAGVLERGPTILQRPSSQVERVVVASQERLPGRRVVA